MKMNYRTMGLYLLVVALESSSWAFARFRNERPSSSLQSPRVAANDASFDPLQELRGSFAGSIKLNEKRRLIEFCPDETCDGFVASSDVSMSTMKDFAYLYVYYFSDYLAYLPEWRKHADASAVAERILSKPEFHNCKKDNSRETARCVLTDLSRNGRIKLLFIRYDEGQRNVVPQNIVDKLKEKNPGSTPN
jgi:hypothetical protein